MRKLYTLFLVFSSAVMAFGQLRTPTLIEHPTYINRIHFDHPESLTRSVSNCDSNDLLDYSSYTEVLSLLQGDAATSVYGFNGVGPGNPVYINQLTSFVTAASASVGALTYAGQAFDTLAFQDFPNKRIYGYPLASSTITLNGLIFGYQYYADTVAADGLIANDSLVFTFYAINNSFGLGIIDSVPAGEVVMAGDSLAKLYTGPDVFGFSGITASVPFAQGQGFYVKVEYLNKDTSSHFSMATTFIDSCGLATYVYNGQSIKIIAADLSPLTPFIEDPNDTIFGGPQYGGLTFFGAIVADNTIYNENNEWGYQGIGLVPDPPIVCSYTSQQHFVLMPIINVCTAYSVQVLANTVTSCPGGTVDLAALVIGSPATTAVTPNTLQQGGQTIQNLLHLAVADTTGLTYTWSSSSGSLSSTTSAAPVLTMPASGDVTVTVSVSDGADNASASLVITNNAPIIISITNSPQPVVLTCGGTVTLQLSASGDTSGHLYSWTGPGTNSSGANDTSLIVSFPGEYYVTAQNSLSCPVTDSVAVIYPGGVNNVVSFTGPDSLCSGQAGEFINTSSSVNGWTALWNFGDGHVSDTLNSTSHIYTSSGNFAVQLEMDSGGCLEVSPVAHVKVSAGPSAAISASGPTTFCLGNNITLSTTAGLSQYQWSNGGTFDAISVDSSGNYSVTVTNQYGCSAASGNTVVIVNPLPTVALNGFPATICNTGYDTLTGGSPSGGSYSGVYVSGGIFHPSLAGPGSYTITYSYTDGNGCTNTATGNLIVENCTGINEIALDNIRIFPNPTGDVINIYNAGVEGLVADLTDVSGKAVIAAVVITGNGQALDLTACSAGVYLLRLHDKAGNMRVMKVVKD